MTKHPGSANSKGAKANLALLFTSPAVSLPPLPRLIAGCAAVAAIAAWEHPTGASNTEGCPTDGHVRGPALLPPDTESDVVFASDGVPSTEELAGSWPGSLTMTAFSSPYGPAKGPLAAQIGKRKKLTVTFAPAGPNQVSATFTTESPRSFTMTYNGGRLSGGFTEGGQTQRFEGTVIQSGDSLRIDGTWSAKAPAGAATLTGVWEASKSVPDVTVELLHPVGKSPKVFRTGWLFGAKCTRRKGKPDEEDLSNEVKWSGSGSFAPAVGNNSRPSFTGTGSNKIKLTCRDTTTEFPIDVTASKRAYAGLTDLAKVPSDAHGCPACPHPSVGPIISGSPQVLVNGKPAARVGDVGIHAACCGPNMFRITAGDPFVLINGRPAARKGDETSHCGGSGSIITGRTIDPRDLGEPGVTGPAAPDSVEPSKFAIADKGTVSTNAGERAVLRFGKANAQPSTATLFPNSKASRESDGSLALKNGGALVTSPGDGSTTTVKVDGAEIKLKSQAVLRMGDGRIEMALLTGNADVKPKRGSSIVLSAGQFTAFSASGVIEPPKTTSMEDLQRLTLPLAENASTKAVGSGLPTTWIVAGVAAVVVFAGVGVVALALILFGVLMYKRRARARGA